MEEDTGKKIQVKATKSSNWITEQSALRKDEIVHQLFGDVGDTVLGDYSCAIEGRILIHGRLYVTNKFLCFYSNLFSVEKKLRIPFNHIKSITKENTAMVIPNAICITTFRRNITKEYIFRSFWDRDECYRIIADVLKRSQLKDLTSHSPVVPRFNGGVEKSRDQFDVTGFAHEPNGLVELDIDMDACNNNNSLNTCTTTLATATNKLDLGMICASYY